MILSARYRQTRPPKNQIVAVTHTGEILPRRSHTVATRRSHLHVETACSRIYTGDFYATRFEDFLCVKISLAEWFTHTGRDSLSAIAFGKNRRRVSNTCDLRCRLYFARLDATIVLARDHLHEVDFNVLRVPGRSRSSVNSKSYAIYESPRHSAMHKCSASRWLRLS